MAQYYEGNKPNAKANKDSIDSIWERLNKIEKEVKASGVTAQEAMDNMNDAIDFTADPRDYIVEYREMKDNVIISWKPLDIDSLPDRFFTRDDIEIEQYVMVCVDPGYCGKIQEWVNCSNEKILRPHIITLLQERNVKYRYRLKELKRIRITRDIIKKYKLPVTEVIREKADNTMPHSGLLENVFILDGHDVEILDK
jgi:hypothetical protein